jgi:hydrogenase maturation protein HypF
LPGGDKAAYEPQRSALGLLAATLGENAQEFSKAHWPNIAVEALWHAMKRGISAPWTSSMGRLFDAIAALLGIRQVNTFDGQAAMELEWCAATNSTNADDLPPRYPIPISDGPLGSANLTPLVQGLLTHRQAGMATSEIAARFISSLVELGLHYCQRAGLPRVVLAGGCFQNDLLTRALVKRLEQSGFEPFLPQQVPINDGGISAGQVVIAAEQTAIRGGD